MNEQRKKEIVSNLKELFDSVTGGVISDAQVQQLTKDIEDLEADALPPDEDIKDGSF